MFRTKIFMKRVFQQARRAWIIVTTGFNPWFEIWLTITPDGVKQFNFCSTHSGVASANKSIYFLPRVKTRGYYCYSPPGYYCLIILKINNKNIVYTYTNKSNRNNPPKPDLEGF